MADIYLHIDGQQAGPYQPFQVQHLLTEGKINGETPAWHKDLPAWSTVTQILAQFSGAIAVPPPPPAWTPPSLVPEKTKMNGCLMTVLILAAMCVIGLPIIAILAGIALGPITNGIKKAKESMGMQVARSLELAMFQYGVDHNGEYPTGSTSTEVFQKLIDEKYISDPGIFYLDMPGKVRATSKTLKPENVCFDVTSGINGQTSDFIPVVFSTGYTVTYAPEAAATRNSASSSPFAGIAVAYKNTSARFIKAQPDGDIPAFISPQFDSGTGSYKQLEP